MGLTAIVSSSASSAGAGVTSLLSPVGLGAGGIFVAAALIYLLAYLDFVDASEAEHRALKRMLIASIIPLFVVFAGVVVFRTLAII